MKEIGILFGNLNEQKRGAAAEPIDLRQRLFIYCKQVGKS